MNTSLACAVAGLIGLSAPLRAASPAAPAPQQVMELSGSVEIQPLAGHRQLRRRCGTSTVALGSTATEETVAGGTTIKVLPLSTARIFSEFNVTSKNYLLLITPSGTLTLWPKRGVVGPAILVLSLSPGTVSVSKTKPNIVQGEGTVAGPANTTIFNGVTGTYLSTKTTPPPGPRSFAKTVYNITAFGNSSRGSSANKGLLMQLRLTTSGPLLQP